MRKEKRLYARPNMPLLFRHWFSFLRFLPPPPSAGHLRYTCFIYYISLSFSLFLLFAIMRFFAARDLIDYIAAQITRNNHAHAQIHTHSLTSPVNIQRMKKYSNFSLGNSFVQYYIRHSSFRFNFSTFFNFEKKKEEMARSSDHANFFFLWKLKKVIKNVDSTTWMIRKTEMWRMC